MRCVWTVGAMVGLLAAGGAMIVSRRGPGLGTVGRAGGEGAATVVHGRMDG
jgi:hypothetical protein